jgi:hypothetical protein
MAKKKNPAAVALAKLRLSRMSSEDRSAVGRAGATARNLSLTAEQRREIARKAGLAGGRGRKKKPEPSTKGARTR